MVFLEMVINTRNHGTHQSSRCYDTLQSLNLCSQFTDQFHIGILQGRAEWKVHCIEYIYNTIHQYNIISMYMYLIHSRSVDDFLGPAGIAKCAQCFTIAALGGRDGCKGTVCVNSILNNKD